MPQTLLNLPYLHNVHLSQQMNAIKLAGHQLCQTVEKRINQHSEKHPSPCYQSTDVQLTTENINRERWFHIKPGLISCD